MMFENEIQTISKKHGLDPNLVRAICMTESSMNPWVMRYESHYKWLYFVDDYAYKLHISKITEETMQKFSYGLGQLMGALCRELGFDDYLIKLCDPVTNLTYMCRHLKRLSEKYSQEADIISAYNAGSPRKTTSGLHENFKYVDKVHAELLKYRALT